MELKLWGTAKLSDVINVLNLEQHILNGGFEDYIVELETNLGYQERGLFSDLKFSSLRPETFVNYLRKVYQEQEYDLPFLGSSHLGRHSDLVLNPAETTELAEFMIKTLSSMTEPTPS